MICAAGVRYYNEEATAGAVAFAYGPSPQEDVVDVSYISNLKGSAVDFYTKPIAASRTIKVKDDP